ncbi:MAG: hypothetical protein ACLU4P_06580 [Ruminococcus sp.]
MNTARGTYGEKDQKTDNIPIISVVCFYICMAFPGQVQAASHPYQQDNLSVRIMRPSDLISISNGVYASIPQNKQRSVLNTMTTACRLQTKEKFGMEPWGGFYAGSDGYYPVEVKITPPKIILAEVIRVIRYDTNWNRSGAASIHSNPDLFGGEVRYPFDYGCVEMTETNGTLIL